MERWWATAYEGAEIGEPIDFRQALKSVTRWHEDACGHGARCRLRDTYGRSADVEELVP